MRSVVTMHLPYEPPLDWSFLLRFLQLRKSRGVEFIKNDTYMRTAEIDGDTGRIEVSHEPARARERPGFRKKPEPS